MRAAGGVKAVVAGLGAVAYALLLAPSVLRASHLCRTGAYDCLGPHLPMQSDLVMWAIPLVPLALFASARLRAAEALVPVWRAPPSPARTAAGVSGLLCAITAYGSSTHLGRNWPEIDWLAAAAWLLLGAWLLAVAGLVRPAAPVAETVPDQHARWWRLAGILLYAAMLAAIFGQVAVTSPLCRPDSVCDGPMYALVGELVLWTAGIPLVAALLAAAFGPGGIRPWPAPEPRIALVYVAFLLLLFGAMFLRAGLAGVAVGAGYAGFGVWLIAVSRICGSAASIRKNGA